MKQSEEFRFLILAAQREGSRLFAELMRPLGLTPSQSEVLRVLHDHEPLSMAELGELLVCETGSPSRLVNRLVESGHVVQKPSETDSRKVKLTLSQLGQLTATQIIAIEEKLYTSLDSMLIGAPVEEMKELLWRLIDGKPAGQALIKRKNHSERSNFL